LSRELRKYPERDLSRMNAVDLADFDAVKRALGLNDEAEVWRAGWAASQGSYAREGERFLDAATLEDACRFLRMAPDLKAALAEHRTVFDKVPALKRLAWHCRALFFRRADMGYPPPASWPPLPPTLGDAAHLFYAYVVLAGVRALQAEHHLKGVPDEITVETLRDIERWMEDYRARHGVYGFDKVRWLELHFTCRLFQLGRLQFEMRTWAFDFTFLRDRFTQRVVAMCPDGARFRRDGQWDGADGVRDPQASSAQYRPGHKIIRGNPVRPDGVALTEVVSLPTVEWEPMLKRGDRTLGVHIPEGERLTPEACTDAFEHAEGFFAMYFPDHDYKAFETDSWLLDCQHAAYLPESSNIVRFQQRFYVLPGPDADDEQLLDRVFFGKFKDVDTAPRDTALQRHIVAHMRQGGRWRTALGVIFPEDLGRGPHYYRDCAAGTPWQCPA